MGFLQSVQSLIRMSRPGNVLMAAAATVLGCWFGRTGQTQALLLACAAACAVAFGNAVNDLFDIETDRISHPERPLVTGKVSAGPAGAFAVILAIAAMLSAAAVSPGHAAGTALPLLVLWWYAARLKRTPIAGNAAVALLTAYPVMFGAMGTTALHRLWVPAGLAFLLNMAREIIKDVQDSDGDRAAGIVTSAVVPAAVLQAILAILSAAYLVALFLPVMLHHLGHGYTVVCCGLVLPLHAWRAVHQFDPRWRQRTGLLSRLLKLEMLAGLAALAAGWVTAG